LLLLFAILFIEENHHCVQFSGTNLVKNPE